MTDAAELYSQLNSHFQQRSWESALTVAAELLPLAPRHPAVYYIAGISNLEIGHLPQAVECLRKASALSPASIDYAVNFARALVASNRNREAKIVADYASSLSSNDPAVLDALGVVQSQIGSYDAAVTSFRQVVALAPHHAPYRYNFATSLIASGEIRAAESQIEACLSLDMHHWHAHLTLAQLRRQTSNANHTARLTSALSSLGRAQKDKSALTCLHLALSKECEDLGRYADAFEHLVKGKAAAGVDLGYSIAGDEVLFSAIANSFPEPIVAKDGYPSREPIFVIGMPRSGTTLVERIISSHPDVGSAGELLNFAMSVKHFSKSESPDLISKAIMESATDIDRGKLGELYLSSTRPSTGEKPRFIDKLPHNFLYAGLIANALPNAKIVCLRRNPMDTCLSNFRQLFSSHSPFFNYSFDLMDTGRYYLLFDRLMKHWQRVLPGRILEVDYEKLVDSQEAHSRQIIEFCDLSWDDRCLRFQDNPGPVATASWVQVRSPIYRSSVERWRKYESQLQELQNLFEAAGIQVDQ